MLIKSMGLPCTQLNDINSHLYAKVINIKTDVTNNNPAVPSVTKYSPPTRLLFRVFSYTTTSFEDIVMSLRIKTGYTDVENSMRISKTPSTFTLAFIKERDGSISIYAKCNQYEQVKFQLIEGADNNVTYYYNSLLNVDITSLTQLPITMLKDDIEYGDTQCNSVVLNTKVGGIGVVPARDGSIPLGSSTKRFKGGYFTDRLGFPTLITGTPSNPQNGDTYFHATSKKICTYYNGNWYADGVVFTPN